MFISKNERQILNLSRSNNYSAEAAPYYSVLILSLYNVRTNQSVTIRVFPNNIEWNGKEDDYSEFKDDIQHIIDNFEYYDLKLKKEECEQKLKELINDQLRTQDRIKELLTEIELVDPYTVKQTSDKVQLIRELRDMIGTSLSQSKRLLEETNYDLTKAILLEKGL